jgi:DNA processing protein
VLTERAEDIMAVLGDLLRRPLAEGRRDRFAAAASAQPSESELASARSRVVESLGPSPVTVDSIIRECQLSASVVSLVLLELELAGRLERHPGNQVALLAFL